MMGRGTDKRAGTEFKAAVHLRNARPRPLMMSAPRENPMHEDVTCAADCMTCD